MDTGPNLKELWTLNDLFERVCPFTLQEELIFEKEELWK
jgi:hypothetical protein